MSLICCPNANLLYGGGAFNLGHQGVTGVVIQVPEYLCENDIFWLYSLYDARTNQFGAYGKQHDTKPGFYLIVGPKWDPATNPDPRVFDEGHRKVCHTDLAITTARIFMTACNRIPEWLEWVNFYPAEQYNGEYQPGKWESVTNIHCPGPTPKKEMRFVHPLTFFDQLPAILDSVDAQDDEEKELYSCFRKLLKLAEHPRVMRICRAVARETERTTIQDYMQWSMNGVEAGNGWYTSVDSGQWKSTEYAYRTATAKSNLFENRPEDTRYYYTDNETNGQPLNGKNIYAITFESGPPPARGPWSITVHNQFHFLYAFPYSISKADPCLSSSNPITVCAGPRPVPGCCWIRTPPNEPFSLYLRAYWVDESKPWLPPRVEKYKIP